MQIARELERVGDLAVNIAKRAIIITQHAKIDKLYDLEEYTLITKKDNPPQIIIKKPNYEFEIDEQYSIDISANILDDIGVENIWIEYSIFNPDFPDFF